MKWRLAIIGVLAGAMIAGLRLWSPVDGEETLRQAYERASRASYVGNVVSTVFDNGRESSTRSVIRHSSTGERIEYSAGPAHNMIIIRDGGETRTYRPEVCRVVISRAPQTGAQQSLDLLLKNYSAVAGRSSRVAGRDVNVIRLTPRHRGNPSKKLWIDKTTGVILRSEDRSASGELKSRMEFTSVDYRAQSADIVLKEPGCVNASWVRTSAEQDISQRELEKAVGLRVERPGYLPAGYVADGFRVYQCNCKCGHKAAHLRYTNGLNSISIYETPIDMACGDMCKVHCPAGGRCEVRDAGRARVATAGTKDRTVIVVSDLPESEIRKVAESIR